MTSAHEESKVRFLATLEIARRELALLEYSHAKLLSVTIDPEHKLRGASRPHQRTTHPDGRYGVKTALITGEDPMILVHALEVADDGFGTLVAAGEAMVSEIRRRGW